MHWISEKQLMIVLDFSWNNDMHTHTHYNPLQLAMAVKKKTASTRYLNAIAVQRCLSAWTVHNPHQHNLNLMKNEIQILNHITYNLLQTNQFMDYATKTTWLSVPKSSNMNYWHFLKKTVVWINTISTIVFSNELKKNCRWNEPPERSNGGGLK